MQKAEIGGIVRSLAQRGLFLLPFLFLGVFYVYPLLAILRVSFLAEGTGLGVLATFGDPRFWRRAQQHWR